MLNGRNQLAATVLLSLMTITLASSQAMAQADGDTGDGVDGTLVFIWIVMIILSLLIVFSLYASVVIIRPYEQGLKIILGNYAGRINPGLNFVPPFITKVKRVDLRTQVFDMTDLEVLFRDKSRGAVDAVFNLKVVDPEKAYFQVANYKLAVVSLGKALVKAKMMELTFSELMDNRQLIIDEVEREMAPETDPWGVKVEKFELLDMREK